MLQPASPLEAPRYVEIRSTTVTDAVGQIEAEYRSERIVSIAVFTERREAKWINVQ
jgi:hypothetical protein